MSVSGLASRINAPLNGMFVPRVPRGGISIGFFSDTTLRKSSPPKKFQHLIQISLKIAPQNFWPLICFSNFNGVSVVTRQEEGRVLGHRPGARQHVLASANFCVKNVLIAISAGGMR